MKEFAKLRAQVAKLGFATMEVAVAQFILSMNLPVKGLPKKIGLPHLWEKTHCIISQNWGTPI